MFENACVFVNVMQKYLCDCASVCLDELLPLKNFLFLSLDIL